MLCVSIRLKEKCLVECPTCRNAFVEWVRASAEACVPCANTRVHEYMYRARVLCPFRSVILRSEIHVFAYRKDFFLLHAPDARTAWPRSVGRGFVQRINWQNRNESTGIVIVLASHALPFLFSLFCARLASQRSRVSFFRLERISHGREQESVWDSRSIIALPTYSRIPFVSVLLTNAPHHECKNSNSA